MVNWGVMVMVILLVLGFGSSSNLAAAYGIAVTGAMFIDTCLLSVVLFTLWKWPAWKALPVLAVFFIRSEEHTSELQSLMRISYAVFCLKKKHHKSSTYT